MTGGGVVGKKGVAQRIGLVGGWSFPASMFGPLVDGWPEASFDVYDWRSFASDWLGEGAPMMATQPDVWLGWSLGGGLLLEALARGRIRPQRLVLVNATPRFLAEAGWPGVSRTEWRALRQAARRNPRRAAEDFHRHFSLEGGGALPTEECAEVGGLDWLADIDARGLLASTSVPVEIWLAADDPLIPSAWAESLPLAAGVTLEKLSRPGHGAIFECWSELANRLVSGW